MATSTIDQVDQQLQDIIHNLYVLMIQSYDYYGHQTAEAMVREVQTLTTKLKELSHSSRNLNVSVPAEIIEYVELGRNPDIYTREFVERVQEKNQELKGKAEAFAQFRDTLAREIMSTLPDLKEVVESVVEETGGARAAP